MSLSELCIRRPVMTTLMMVSFLIAGFFAWFKLPVAALPRVDFPTIAVTADLAGASPETMAASIAAPLERSFATIPGLTAMISSSGRGTTSITLTFDLDRNIDGAALDVQTQISATLKRLPADLTSPPTYRKSNPGDSPVLFLALIAPTLLLSKTNDYAEQVFAQQISQLAGVAQVQILGQQKYAVRIQVDPDEAAARNLTLSDVRSAVALANSSSPVGVIKGKTQNITLEATGQMERAEAYRPLVVAWHNGSPVRLDEIARVREGVENETVAAWFNDERAIILAVYRQSDANTVEVVDSVLSRLGAFKAALPAAVDVKVLFDRSVSIRQSVDDVQFTLALSIALVVGVIFLFLKSAGATMIPLLALPVSLVGSCAFMWALGYSIDNISLMAITLSVGFVVDDAIVMLENISRHIEEGMKPFEAALKGASEISFTILSITVSLVAVFIPVFFMSGVVGRVFREFAATISIAILVSGVVSLTMTPMLCARILRPVDHAARPTLFARFSDLIVDGMLAFYRVTLDAVLKLRLLMLVVIAGSMWLTYVKYNEIPQDFVPSEDNGFVFGATEGPADSSFDRIVEKQKQAVALLGKDPAVDYVASAAGFGGPNRGLVFVALKPKAVRGPIDAVMGRLRKATSGVPGFRVFMQPIQNLQFSAGRPPTAKYQYTLQSADLAELYARAPQMEKALTQIPGLRDVNSDLRITNPQASVELDREKASAFGITSDQVCSALFNAYGTRQASTIYTQAADYQVILEAGREFQNDPEALRRIQLRGQSGVVADGPGAMVRLDQVASIRSTVGPLTINRQAQQPAVTISFNLLPDVSLGQAIELIKASEKQAGLPASIVSSFSGSAALFQEAQKGQGLLLLAAVVTIYILLGILYESFIHPITILSGLPSAALGAILALQYMNMPLSIIAIFGILLLIGIVKKNAIMMVDFAIGQRVLGVDALTAIREAALVRFRPIMMTSFAALLGALPLALGDGAGSELRKPLGVTIVGGLLLSQVLTLYITPVIYYYLDKIDSRFAGRRTPAPAPLPVWREEAAAAVLRPAQLPQAAE